MSLKSVVIGCVLTGTALGASALTIGRARGAAWIGQPLDLVVQVQLDPGQTDGAVCAEADVYHADSLQESNRVKVTVEPTGQSDTYNIRILSSALVDEPVVSVYLRAGCGQKSSRKFVLLADYPSDAVVPLSRAAEPSAPVVPTVVPQSPVASAAATGTATASQPIAAPPKPAAERKPKPAVEHKASAKAPAAPKVIQQPTTERPAPAPVPEAPAAPVVSKPRLKLDPLENLSDRIKTLEASNPTPAPDSALEAERMAKLQGDVRALLDQAAKNEASLAAMRERMEKAESERVSMTVVYALLALVAACLGALVYLWKRRPQAVSWDNDGAVSVMQPLQTAADNQTPDAGVQAAGRGRAGPDSRFAVDVDLMDMDEASFTELLNSRPGSPNEKTKA